MKSRPKIMSIVGTRPEAIKMAPVVLELNKHSDKFDHILVSTAQHRKMLDQVFEAFGIQPDIDLDLMRPDQSLCDFASRSLETLGQIFSHKKPDMVLVQGDTTTVMSATLAAFFQRIPVGHVEAGLRTFDRHNPFPEEVNRRIVSASADLHFVPTKRSENNLLNEGFEKESIFLTGNTIVDALQIMPVSGPFENETLRTIPFSGRRILMVTAHRRENHGAPLTDICKALRILAERFSDIEIVYPVHLNPNVCRVVKEQLGHCPRIHLVEPLAYPDLLRLISRSHLILTDSGGIQEEAPSFHKPVLILRETTERPEVVDVGVGQLVGTDADFIVARASELLINQGAYTEMSNKPNPFGDGLAAQRIIQIIANHFGMQGFAKFSK